MVLFMLEHILYSVLLSTEYSFFLFVMVKILRNEEGMIQVNFREWS